MEPTRAVEGRREPPAGEVAGRVEEVRRAVEGFARACSTSSSSEKAARELGRALSKLYGFAPAELDVVFAQSALTILLSSLLYELERPKHNLRPLRELLEGKGLLEGLKEAMEGLERRGCEMATVTGELLLPLPAEAWPAVRKLVEEAERSARETQLFTHDFLGRVFHVIAGDIALRKGLATYYTEVPAAYLLAWLAVRELARIEPGGVSREEILKTVERLRGARVADFACGSGTLLVAAHHALSRLSGLLCSSLGTSCPESEVGNIYGFDAQKYASQIAAVNLYILSGGSAGNVYTVPFGYSQGAPLLGSLELLESSRLRATREAPLAGPQGAELELPEGFDLIIMNPPFTRATGRTEQRFAGAERGLFGFLEERARRALRRRYSRLQRRVREELTAIAEELFREEQLNPPALQRGGRGGYRDITHAGEGLLFLYLAYKRSASSGTIAFVLPRNLLAGNSWFLARALLAQKFHLKYVIVSSDGRNGYNFSESTSLSECLIVARRSERHSDEEETVFVNFYRKPRRVEEALRRVEEVAQGRAEGAVMIRVRRGDLMKNLDNFNRFVALPQEEAVYAALKALEGDLGLLRVPVRRLGELAGSIGVHSTLFHRSFEVIGSAPRRYPLLHGGGEGNRTKMLARPNAEGRPLDRRAEGLFSRFAGRLLLPDRVWLDTAHVIAMYSETPLLSNVFYSVRLKGGEEAEKAVALWLNTTWGLLGYLANREETRGRWTRLTRNQWELLPVIDVEVLGEVKRRLAEAFDRLAERQPRRIPQQFRGDPVREEIDLEFLTALEPSIDREAALPQLRELYAVVDLALARWIP